jgi:hypothetical protein
MGSLCALLALVLVPLLLLGVAFKVLITLILLPFKVVGALVKGLFGLVAGVFGLAAGGIGLVFGLLVMLVVLVLLPLAPLLLLGGIVWLALKAGSPAARPA